MDPVAQLQEIIAHGAPGQADLARRLLAADAQGDIVDALYDAYLNDPYLTRF